MKKVLRRQWKLIDGAYYASLPTILGTAPKEEHMIERTAEGWKLSQRIRNGVCLGGVSFHPTLEAAQLAGE